MAGINIKTGSSGNINLKINKSAFVGNKSVGMAGKDGANGLSAYEIYIKHNPDPPLTENEFADSFKFALLADDYLTLYNNAKSL